MKFTKVKDVRGHDIRGLWQRGPRFYAQIRLNGKQTKVPLRTETGEWVETVPKARERLNELLAARNKHEVVIVKQAPTLGEWADIYLQYLESTRSKEPLTIKKERGHLKKWVEHFGGVRIRFLLRSHIDEFVESRQEEEVCNRTINLDMIALGNCLEHAKRHRLIDSAPTDDWEPLKHISPKQPFWTAEQIDRLCECALQIEETKQKEEKRYGCGQMFVDFVRFCQHTGARRSEASNVKWSDIDWERKVVTLNKTKYGHPREVDFNPGIEAHLLEMQKRRRPDSEWLFPSPRSGEEDSPICTLQNTLYPAREAAGMPGFAFHALRHHFISVCVMRGIDFMTIARWVGHKDGGVLIGKVYGKITDKHSKEMAARLTVAPKQDTSKAANQTGDENPTVGHLQKLLLQLQSELSSLQTGKAAA